MQRWEYCSVELRPIGAVLYSRGWRIRAIDEKEQPEWRKAEAYASVAAFCNHMDQYRWELISLNYFANAFALLLFKRPRSNEISQKSW